MVTTRSSQKPRKEKRRLHCSTWKYSKTLRVLSLTLLTKVHLVNTKKWYRKGIDLWVELGDEIPFG
jgi:hypothetical protein